jgi:hypothetical protein
MAVLGDAISEDMASEATGFPQQLFAQNAEMPSLTIDSVDA